MVDIISSARTNYSKISGTETRYKINEPLGCNEILVIIDEANTTTPGSPNVKSTPNITIITIITRQKINSEPTKNDENPLILTLKSVTRYDTVSYNLKSALCSQPLITGSITAGLLTIPRYKEHFCCFSTNSL